MSISDGLPVSIQTVLEGINRGGGDDMLRKTVPGTDHPLTEEVFPEIEMGSVDRYLENVSTQTMWSVIG